MDRFVSTFTNKIDAKGRVSIPAPFRAVLERDGYAGSAAASTATLRSMLRLSMQAARDLRKKIDGLLEGLPDYSDERDELSVALYGDVQVLAIDGDGRISLPESLRAHAGLQPRSRLSALATSFRCGSLKPSKNGASAPAKRSPTPASCSVQQAPVAAPVEARKKVNH